MNEHNATTPEDSMTHHENHEELDHILAGDPDAVARAMYLGRPGGHVSSRWRTYHAEYGRTGCECVLCGATVEWWTRWGRRPRHDMKIAEHECTPSPSQVVRAARAHLAHQELRERAREELAALPADARLAVPYDAPIRWRTRVEQQELRQQAKRIRDRERARERRAAATAAATNATT